jgi:hypothetical protein
MLKRYSAVGSNVYISKEALTMNRLYRKPFADAATARRLKRFPIKSNVYHKIDEIRIENGILSLRVDGQRISKTLAEISPALASASNKEISHYEISPSGYGIYWPLLDEDISIDGLLGIQHSAPQWKKSA